MADTAKRRSQAAASWSLRVFAGLLYVFVGFCRPALCRLVLCRPAPGDCTSLQACSMSFSSLQGCSRPLQACPISLQACFGSWQVYAGLCGYMQVSAGLLKVFAGLLRVSAGLFKVSAGLFKVSAGLQASSWSLPVSAGLPCLCRSLHACSR